MANHDHTVSLPDGSTDKPTDPPHIAASAVISTKFTATAVGGKKKHRNESPQKNLADFWSAFQARKPGRITSVFPRRLYEQLGLYKPTDVLGWPSETTSGVSTPASSSSWAAVSAPSTPTVDSPPSADASVSASASYESAAAACRAAVGRIVSECHRTNEKFTDPEFNLEEDPKKNCLRGLFRRLVVHGGEEDALQPMHTPPAVHRVDWIFEKPVFVRERKSAEHSEEKKKDNNSSTGFAARGFSSSDVQQGRVGDCWWIAAVATMAHRTDLMQRVCVARDETCGVYGFVFVRDGQWTPVVVDDNLYLHHDDFCAEKYDASGQRARDHRQRFQRGSEALSFARCADANETWLPLLEKAFAKLHGDYGALSGGWCSEGMEDLTGGVSTTVVANRVLDKDKLWQELSAGGGGESRDENNDDLVHSCGGDFVFGLSVMGCGCYLANHNGLTVNHCYSVLQAVEAESEDGKDTVRLVKIRNPWGQRSENTHMGAWHGPWADGAKEWTPYWLKKLGHTFGDDGVFWMSYQDMLETFGYLHRTRLFDASWTTVQQWTTLNVGWVAGYSGTHFVVDVKEPGLVVVVLSQLDTRYYRGLRGQYDFSLHFVLQSPNGTPLSIVHTPNANETRSISCEVVLPIAGKYIVRPQVKAKRDKLRLSEAAVVKMTVEENPDKLRQIGQQYDAAHAKGADVEDEDKKLEERRARKVQRVRARNEWQKAEAKRLREARVAWVLAKEEFRLRRVKRMQDAETQDDEKAGGRDEKKVDDTVKDKDDKMGDEKDKKMEMDIDPGPEPIGFPEPDFSDSELDAQDSDDLLDGESDGEEAVAELRKAMNKKGWPFIDERDEFEKEEARKLVKIKTDGRHRELDDSQPWNAVCVVGLRVFAKDPAVSISLVKPDKKKMRRKLERTIADVVE
ncbi:hypothetical protein Sste5346_002019 [Sporothrix stenoceras]|uniref:Calpain catalytic domain-containing protein n=1 Tax=Sporothrix stenoceras TaxID=5173 RepID=A0ABR3ZM96_9PEZI